MIRHLLTTMLLLLITQPLVAHFMFVHVVEDDQPHAEIHFAESAWDFSSNGRMVGLIAKSKAWLPDGTPLALEERPYGLVAPLNPGMNAACAAFTYGLMTRGESFLLEYHAKGVSGLSAAADPVGLDAEVIATFPDSDRMVVTVLFRGDPVANAEVIVPMEGAATETLRTDELGQVVVPTPRTPLFSIRAMIPEERDGVWKESPYGLVRHYTTLTVHAAPEREASRSDGLARAILQDAYGCSSPHPVGGATWTGEFNTSFDGEELQGSIAHDGTHIRATDPGTLTDRQIAHLNLIDGLPAPGVFKGASIRFAQNRPASVGSRIVVDEAGIEFEIRDRRINSVRRPTKNGSQRVDVIEWTTTADQRELPKRHLITDFDRAGRIERVLMLEQTYENMGGMHVLASQRGSHVTDANNAGQVMLQLNNVVIGEAPTSDV